MKGMATTNGIESFWAMLNRGITGTYHHISHKHVGRYASEFAGRHNERPKDTVEQIRGMIQGWKGSDLDTGNLRVSKWCVLGHAPTLD